MPINLMSGNASGVHQKERSMQKYDMCPHCGGMREHLHRVDETQIMYCADCKRETHRTYDAVTPVSSAADRMGE
jgi:ribosomal protein L37AE/L43A